MYSALAPNMTESFVTPVQIWGFHFTSNRTVCDTCTNMGFPFHIRQDSVTPVHIWGFHFTSNRTVCDTCTNMGFPLHIWQDCDTRTNIGFPFHIWQDCLWHLYKYGASTSHDRLRHLYKYGFHFTSDRIATPVQIWGFHFKWQIVCDTCTNMGFPFHIWQDCDTCTNMDTNYTWKPVISVQPLGISFISDWVIYNICTNIGVHLFVFSTGSLVSFAQYGVAVLYPRRPLATLVQIWIIGLNRTGSSVTSAHIRGILSIPNKGHLWYQFNTWCWFHIQQSHLWHEATHVTRSHPCDTKPPMWHEATHVTRSHLCDMKPPMWHEATQKQHQQFSCTWHYRQWWKIGVILVRRTFILLRRSTCKRGF